MANFYWWNDGVTPADWDNTGNWWQEDSHSTPSGAIPTTGDSVYFVGTNMPNAGPSSSVTLAAFDTNAYSDAGTWIGFQASSVTADVTVTDTLTFGKNGDLTGEVVYWGGIASSGCAVQLYGKTKNQGAMGSGGAVDVVYYDESHDDGTTTYNATSGNVTFNGSSICASAMTMTGTASMTFQGGYIDGASITVPTVSLVSGTISNASISATTFNISGGTIEAVSSVTIAALTVNHTNGAVASCGLSASANYIMSGGSIGSADYSLSATFTFSSNAPFSMSGGIIYSLALAGVGTFTQSGGTVNGGDGSSVSVSCLAATLTAGTFANGSLVCSGDVSMASGYTLGSGGGISAVGTVTVNAYSSLVSGNLGVAGATTIINGKQTAGSSYIKQQGILKLPDFTRGKNPFGSGPIF